MSKISYKQVNKIIKKSKNIFVVGHKDIDLDALGAALGLCCYASYYKKKAYIILDDTKLESSSKKVYNLFKDTVDFIKSNEIEEYINKKSLLIVVDTNKVNLINNPKILNKFNNILVIDHHSLSEKSIDDSEADMLIDKTSSSTCEMITKMMKSDNVMAESSVATILLAGIVLDTNNFIIRTSYRTYYLAYYLTKSGADPIKVQYILKQDIAEYIERQKVITEVKVIKNIAVTAGRAKEIYRKEELAKIADTILLFDNIEASFVVGKISKDEVGISSRSMGNVDVGSILEQLGGGGNKNEAGAKIKDKTINEVMESVIKLAKK